jgi:hypothetical protein
MRAARDDVEVGLVVVDSATIFLGLTSANATTTNRTIKALAAEARSIYGAICGRVAIGHMASSHRNPAMDTLRECRLTQQPTGEQTLFTAESLARPTLLQSRVNTLTATLDETHVVSTLDQFIELKFSSTRDRCPPTCAGQWASIVKGASAKVVLASNATERDEAMMKLLLLPHAFLPRAVATRRVESHLKSGRPFDQSSKVSSETRTDCADTRLARAVTRLAEDYKMRAAVKLIQNVSEQHTADINFEEKVTLLRKKFIEPFAPVRLDPLVAVLPFEAVYVTKAIERQSKQAAKAIDGWSRELLVQATHADPSILDDIAAIAQFMLEGLFGDLIVQCLTAGRLVGIPKAEGGIRPIVVSSIWPKLVGTMCLLRSGTTCSPWQYAVGKKEGAAEIIHKLRAAIDGGKAVIKLDICNAFNETKRNVVSDALAHEDPVLKAYFRCMCAPESTMVVFGPEKSYQTIVMREGMRQGDAPSSLLFCKAMQACLCNIAEINDGGNVFAYMDDLHIVCEPECVKIRVQQCVEIITKQGFRVNVGKSRAMIPAGVLIPDDVPLHDTPVDQDDGDMGNDAERENIHFIVRGDNNPFVALGADLNESDAFMELQIVKVKSWFKKVKQVDLHPCLVFTILRICGAPRILYACQAMPPNYTAKLARCFDEECVSCLNDLVGFQVHTTMLHDTAGAGIPDYPANAKALFDNKQDAVATGATNVLPVQLVTNSLATAEQQGTLNEELRLATGGRYHQGEYLFHRKNALTPMEFIVALAMRLNGIPKQLDMLPTTCRCGVPLRNSNEMQDHLTRCEMSAVSHTYRHELVKQAMAGAARSYGITVTSEPTFYTYSSGNAKRPDLVFHTPIGLYTTDVTIVLKEKRISEAADKADSEKSAIHATAVTAMGHKFIPAACESHGYMGPNVYALARALARTIPSYLSVWFYSNFMFRVSCALAKGRVATFMHLSSQVENASSSIMTRRSVYCMDYRSNRIQRQDHHQQPAVRTELARVVSTVSFSPASRAPTTVRNARDAAA